MQAAKGLNGGYRLVRFVNGYQPPKMRLARLRREWRVQALVLDIQLFVAEVRREQRRELVFTPPAPLDDLRR